METTRDTHDDLIRDHLWLSHRLARRFAGRGVDEDDLRQVADLGLVLAASRYDPERGDFAAYAAPTILGELRRHFRDTTWAVRVPRAVQERHQEQRHVIDDLVQELGRQPRDDEIAARSGAAPDEVAAARAAGRAYRSSSLDRPVTEEGGATLGDTLEDDAHPYDHVDEYESLLSAVRRLDDRDGRILHLRFYGDLTQREIGQRLGVSQMQVSRLLSRIMTQLRDDIAA